MNPTDNHIVIDLPDRARRWIERAVQQEASDIHLVPGHLPALRVHGDMMEVPADLVEQDDVANLLTAVCPATLAARLEPLRNIDFSFEAKIGGDGKRFRANVFYTDEQMAACLRLVPEAIPSFDWTGFPQELGNRIVKLQDGLVIVSGITGSGKTTTLAMIVNQINQAGGVRIITVEEPIEYRFPRAANSLVTQREIGVDVLSFSDGLRSGLRQDPDIILVGEIRDRDTGQMALSAAETGHLVLTTLHTRDAKGAISRFADLFPQDVQADIRQQLATSLRSVVCQRLLPNIEPGRKRHLALEILWNSPPIASAIRQGKLDSIDNYLITRRDDGLIGFDESVRQLWQAGKISRVVAERNIRDPSALNW
ncbi:MAG: PilT/PilU family type 4a pilus ATPase [Planctomycetes bacterium]|nr:PilT/PilU family type 4a pilus ATPase [Planctomycetota bacterium]